MAEQLQDPGTGVPVDATSPVGKGASAPIDKNGQPEGEQEVEGGVIDWDVKIETPPPRPSQIVLFRVVDGGKRPIRIPDEVED